MDELQAQHGGAVRLPEGRSAAPEGPDGDIRGAKLSYTDARHGPPFKGH